MLKWLKLHCSVLLQRVGQRAVIVSGMNAAEIGEIIGAYRDAGEYTNAARQLHACLPVMIRYVPAGAL